MSPLDLWIESDAYQARKTLPGHVRQRIKREIESLADELRPPNSRALDVAGLEVPRPLGSLPLSLPVPGTAK